MPNLSTNISFMIILLIVFLPLSKSSAWRLKSSSGSRCNYPLALNLRDAIIRQNTALFSSNENDLGKGYSLEVNKTMINEINVAIFSIAIPALAACIAEPALTLVDTLCVGRFSCSSSSATIGLAALSVCGAVFNIITAITAPLCTATTSIIGLVQGTSSDPSGNMEKFQLLVNGLALACLVGVILTFLVLMGRTLLLEQLFGLTGSVSLAASQYLTIRALSLPSLVVNYVLTGYSLGTGDMLPAVLSICTGTVVNILGDWLLVARMGTGLVGAALATLGASYAGTLVALTRVLSEYGRNRHPSPSTSLLSTSPSGDTESFPSHAKTRRPASIWSQVRVDRTVMAQFCSASVLILAGTLANTLTYSSGSRVAGAVRAQFHLSTVTQVAAQQVAMQPWWLLSYLAVPLSMAAQSLLPHETLGARGTLIDQTAISDVTVIPQPVHERRGTVRGDSELLGCSDADVAVEEPLRTSAPVVTRQGGRATHLLTRLLQLAVGVSVFASTTNVVVARYLTPLFTSSPTVRKLVRRVSVLAGLSQAVLAVATVLDGVYIGSGLLMEYFVASAVSTSVACGCFAVSMARGWGVSGYWTGLLAFSVTRLVYFLARFCEVKRVFGLS